MSRAAIWVDRAGQKPIVIGAGGARLKRVGRAARLELNQLLGERFHLTSGSRCARTGPTTPAPCSSWGWNEAQCHAPHAARAGLRAAPAPVPRHQPDPRGVGARSRPLIGVCARACAAQGALAARLQPFQPLLLSWSGRGEAPQLTGGGEAHGAADVAAAGVPDERFYLNELLLQADDAARSASGLFDAYHAATSRSCAQGAPSSADLASLRGAAARGFSATGWIWRPKLTAGGRSTRHAYYHFRPGRGLLLADAGSPGRSPGSSLVQPGERARSTSARELRRRAA